jgi:anti-sigma factor RsiW
MSCEKEGKTLLMHYGELPPAEEAAARAHAGSCPDCRRLLAGLERAEAMLAASDAPAPAGLAAAALERAVAGGQSLLSWLFTDWRRMAAAAAGVMLMFAVFRGAAPEPAPQVASLESIEESLEDLEYSIYQARVDFSTREIQDFDYKYADMESRKDSV